nr:MAG TPA: hypothetical protein [Caudoviricetes sp.]
MATFLFYLFESTIANIDLQKLYLCNYLQSLIISEKKTLWYRQGRASAYYLLPKGIEKAN